jgi:CubicO group peptidase (beta-lactamase class C family)
MRESWFPRSWPAGPLPGGQLPGGLHPAASPAVTGYDVTGDGRFTPLPGLVCVLPAAGGLWSTAADLARLALGWSSLLPRSLAAQALRPHAARPNGVYAGLGWDVNERAGLAGHGGDGPGVAASLLVTLDGGHACAAMANRQVMVEPVNAQALAAMAGGSPE